MKSIFLLLFILFAAVIALAGLAFWIWMLVDCATKETAQGNNKLVWILVIVLTGVIGALIYFFARRPTRIRELGA
jgi:ABC-type enterochelin transport system permease subunit